MAEPATDVAPAAPAPGRNVRQDTRRRPGLASSTLCESAKEQGDLKPQLVAGVVTSQPLFLREGLEFRPAVIFEVLQETGTAGERGGNVGGKASF